MDRFKDFKMSVGLVKMLQAYAQSRGVAFDKIAKKHGFDTAMLNNGSASIQASVYADIWFQVAKISKDRFPGLNLGKQSIHFFPSSSILFAMMQNSPNIGAALKLLARYHRIMAEKIQPVIRRQDDVVCLSWDFSVLGPVRLPYLSEVFLCACYSMLTKLSNRRIVPVSVNFIHKGPAHKQDKSKYEHYFNAPVRFLSTFDELVIDYQDLDIPIELADTTLLHLLENHADRIAQAVVSNNKWSGRVMEWISKSILSGQVPRVDSIADEFAVSRRSLQQKLKKEGTSFRALVQIVRKKYAVGQLAAPETSICEVAFMLGYSDQSAFNHAFKKWTGKSPKAYIESI